MNDLIEGNKELIIVDEIKDMCLIKNIRHLKTCNCYHHKLKEIYDKLLQEEIEWQKNNKDELYKTKKEVRLNAIKEESYKILFNNIKTSPNYLPYCKKEFDEINKTLEVFKGKLNNKYNLADIKVYTIIKVVLDYQLTSIRMMRESSFEGVLISQQTRDGSSFVLNPVEESKRRYNDSLINAIQTLDKVVSGEKHTHVMITPQQVEDIFKEGRGKDIREVREIP